MTAPPAEPVRCIGLDVHKHSVMLAAVDAQQQVLLRPLRISLSEFPAWARKHLRSTDRLVLEATTNAWSLVDLLQPLVASVIVAHPPHLKIITTARVKTDARDALKLAKLLAAELIPGVWVPPVVVRELRSLVVHRRRLVSQRSQIRNRLQSLLHRHQICPPEGKVFAAKNRAWWEALELSAVERLRMEQDLKLYDAIEALIAESEAEIARLSTMEPWAGNVPFLIQVPGIGVLSAMTILGAIGDITRFPSAKQLVGYSGLGAGVHASGTTRREGAITKEGRRELRGALVEAAWIAVATHPHWKAQFERLEARLGGQKTIVAIARKLLVVIWHVLTHKTVDRHGDEAAIARKLMRWGGQYRLSRRMGLSRGAFVRRYLDRLGIGATLRTVRFAGHDAPVPPVGHGDASPYSRHRVSEVSSTT